MRWLLKKLTLAVYFAILFIINSFVPSTGDRIQVIGHSVLFNVMFCSSNCNWTSQISEAFCPLFGGLSGEIHSSLRLDSIWCLLHSTKAASTQLTPLRQPIGTSNLTCLKGDFLIFPKMASRIFFLPFGKWQFAEGNSLELSFSLLYLSHITSNLTADLVDSAFKIYNLTISYHLPCYRPGLRHCHLLPALHK